MSCAAIASSPEVRAFALEVRSAAGPGGRLRFAHAAPPGARVTVLTLPGRGEMLEKYAPVAAELVRWGCGFLTLDWRGQGGSGRLLPDPRKGHVERFEDYLDDLDAVLVAVRDLNLPPVRLVLAHSMGGQIALRAVGDGRLSPAGLVLVAPMLDIHFKNLPGWLARVIARAAVLAGQRGRWAPGQERNDALRIDFEHNQITTDRARFEAWQALLGRHPEQVIGGVTYGWIDAALRSIDVVSSPAYLRRVRTPCLLVLAAEETIVANEAIRRATAHLPNAELLEVAGARHDLFLAADRERDRLLRAVRAFFDRLSRG